MSAPSIPEGLEPVGVWEPLRNRDWSDGWTDAEVLEFDGWMRDHLGDHREICRVEFYVLDGPLAVVTRHRRNAQGRWYVDPQTGQFAVEPPVVVALSELPPGRLLGS